MSIRAKVDEDLPTEVAERLRSAGHDAQTVVEQRLAGAADEALWRSVQHEGRCLLTADKAFGNAQVFPPGTHGGVVLFRLPRESRAGYARLAELLLATFDLDSIGGAIVVITPDAVRVYRGP